MNHAQSHEAKSIVEVRLEVGELRDFVEEITQKYWDYLAEGTIAKGAKIKFERISVTATCHNCNNTFNFSWREVEKPRCNMCNSLNVELLTGTELEVKEILII